MAMKNPSGIKTFFSSEENDIVGRSNVRFRKSRFLIIRIFEPKDLARILLWTIFIARLLMFRDDGRHALGQTWLAFMAECTNRSTATKIIGFDTRDFPAFQKDGPSDLMKKAIRRR